MATFSDAFFMNGVAFLELVSRIHVCTAAPTTPQELEAFTIGYADDPVISGPQINDGPGFTGRKVTVSAISDGVMTATGNPTHYVLVLRTGELDIPVVVGTEMTAVVGTDGATWTSDEFKVVIPSYAAGRFINVAVYDGGLNQLNPATHLYLLSDIASTVQWEEIGEILLATKASPTISGTAAGSPSGLKRTIAAVADLLGMSNGTATHWALVNEDGSYVIASGPLASSIEVIAGRLYGLSAIDVTFPQGA
jgi:hypothetical protein